MSQQPTQPPKKPLPPVATTSAVGVLLTAFVMAGVPAAILTYQDFASGNHDLASLLSIFGLALLSAISATGALTIHNKTAMPPGVSDALTNTIVPALSDIGMSIQALMSHAMQQNQPPTVNAHIFMPPQVLQQPQAPVQPVPQPYTPIPQAAAQIPVQSYLAPQSLNTVNATAIQPTPPFMPYSPQAANTFSLPAQPMNMPQQPPTDVSSANTLSSIPAMPATPEPFDRWNSQFLTTVIPPQPTVGQGQ